MDHDAEPHPHGPDDWQDDLQPWTPSADPPTDEVWAERDVGGPADLWDDEDDDIDISDEATLALVLQHKGTPAAAEFLETLGSTGYDGNAPELNELLKLVLAAHEEGHLTRDECCYALFELMEEPVFDRAERRSPRYLQLSEALRELEDRYQQKGIDWPAYLDADDYLELNAEWSEELDHQIADWFAELGLVDLAEELRNDRGAFEERLRAGKASLTGTPPPPRPSDGLPRYGYMPGDDA